MSTKDNEIYDEEEILLNDDSNETADMDANMDTHNDVEEDDANGDQADNPEEDINSSEDVEETTDESYTKGSSSRKRLMNQLLSDSDIHAGSLKELLRSIEFNGELFRRNLLFFGIVIICLLGFVTNRYQAQQEMIEEARLKKELDEMNYIWLTRFSELTTAQRQSQIEERLKELGDSTLIHRDAPIIIKADK